MPNVNVHTCTNLCAYLYLWILIYIYIRICTYLYRCLMEIHTCIYLPIYVYTHMYLHRHQYVYIWNMDLFIYLLFSDTPVYLSRHHDVSPSHSPCRFQATAGRRSWPLRATTSSSSTSTAVLQVPAMWFPLVDGIQQWDGLSSGNLSNSYRWVFPLKKVDFP